MFGYLTLSEAAQYVANKTGVQVTDAGILRAGVHGALSIAAPFASTMRNLSAHSNDEVLGLLTIPQRHLLDIETDGQARIIGAFSLDGKTGYSPQVVRTIGQLRVLVSELDRSMDMWVSNPTTAPSGTPESDSHQGKQANLGVDRNRIIAAFPPPKGTTPENWSKTLSSPPKWLAVARIFKGKPSVSALWNPAQFAMAYAEKGYMSTANITVLIRREFAAWLPEWEKYTDSFK